MDILLIAATAKEIEPFFEYYRNTKKTQNIDILITGIGLTAATYRLLKQLQLKQLLDIQLKIFLKCIIHYHIQI